ncbi:hypothetical protein V1517DRAFT_368845 [Lipomyces orientalis]|uniref:Uncharacterized protein n=1 Tax=Lipomyces orientalis TaxID=1233043 RepID=A0ACC3TJ17_9ASCO
MAANRSLCRNVHFYNSLCPDDVFGGLTLNPSILIVASGTYRVSLRGTGEIVTRFDKPLRPGQYDISSDSPEGTISITDEQCITRAYSGTEEGKCVITGIVNLDAEDDFWVGFESAHVFLLSHRGLFFAEGFPRVITDRNRNEARDSGINSCQNGLLMTTCIHQHFDDMSPSGYFHVDGRILDPVCRAPNDEQTG